MKQLESNQYDLDCFTSKDWSGKPVQDGCAMLVAASLLSFILCVVAAGLVPGLGSVGLGILFLGLPIGLGILGIWGVSSANTKFLKKKTAKINETIREITGRVDDHFTVESFKAFVKKGQPAPFLVNGVPGIELGVVRETVVDESAPGATHEKPGPEGKLVRTVRTGNGHQKKPPKTVLTTRVILTVRPPDYGTDSFDRLLSAALNGARPD